MELFKKIRFATLRFDTGFIDVGNSTFRNHLIDGWGADRKDKEGITSAVVAQRTAAVRFFCHSPHIRMLTIRAKTEPGSAEEQTLDVIINGRRIAKLVIRSDYEDHPVPIPAAAVIIGENNIRFVLNRLKGTQIIPGISFDSFTFSQRDGAEEKNPIATQRPNEVGFTSISQGKSKNVLRTPAKSIVSFYERIPSNAQLNVEFGLFDDDSRQASALFSVEVAPEQGVPEQVFSESVKRGYFHASSKSKSVSLKKYENKIVCISLQSSTIANQKTPTSIYWSRAEIVTPKAPPTAEQPKSAAKKASRPNIILYLIDALRADHLQAYGYSKPTSPRISQFAQESTVFERAYAQTAWTRASVATIMTGLYPSSHLTETRLDRLPDFVPTLAKELKSNGYSTYAVVTNGNVGPEFNFHRYYDKYLQLREASKTKEIHAQSDRVFEEVRRILNGPPREPAYLYLHVTDPHEPYTPAPFDSNLPKGCNPDDRKMIVPDTRYGRETYNDAALDCVVALYDSEIRKADHYFGEFIGLLKQKQLYDRSVIILTADHGEEFLEKGMFRHGVSLHEPEIRIPLIIHFPQEIGHSGTRVSTYARHLDVMPTVLNLISARIPAGVQGSSLMDRLEEKSFEGPFFGELFLDPHFGKYAILENYKFLENRQWGRNTEQQLFDLTQDPQERHDLSKKNPIRFGYMKALLQEWNETQQKRKALLKKPPGATLTREQEEALRALGYLQ